MKGRIKRPDAVSGLNLPEAGRIHIGQKSEKGYPVSLDYFRPTGKYPELFTKAFGEKPQTIPIMFTSDDASMVCNERFEYRDDAGALVSYGDGEVFYVWNGKMHVPFEAAKYPDIMERITSRYPTKKGADNWHAVLTLRFLIPAIRDVVGLWQFSTSGAASSIKNIRDSFDGVQSIRGSVLGTVFDLSVQFAKSNKPGSKSRYPVVTMIANDTRIAEVKELLQGGGQKNLLIAEK